MLLFWMNMSKRSGFKEIITGVNNGNLTRTVPHPNQVDYLEQWIMYVICLQYIYEVTVTCVVEKDDSVFLKTIFPSRTVAKHF